MGASGPTYSRTFNWADGKCENLFIFGVPFSFHFDSFCVSAARASSKVRPKATILVPLTIEVKIAVWSNMLRCSCHLKMTCLSTARGQASRTLDALAGDPEQY